MREQAVVADGEPEAGQQPHAEEKAQFHPADRAVGQQPQGDKRADQRQDVEYDEVPPLHLVQVPASNNPDVAHDHTGNILGPDSWAD